VLAGRAYHALICQLRDTNLREKTEAAWGRLWKTTGGPYSDNNEVGQEEFDLVSRFCSRLELVNPLEQLQIGDATSLGFRWIDALQEMARQSKRLAGDVVVNFVEQQQQGPLGGKRVLVVTLPTHSGMFTYIAVDVVANKIVEFALCRSVTGPSVSSAGFVGEEERAVVEAALRFVASAMWRTITV
jgi:hypothetical protein